MTRFLTATALTLLLTAPAMAGTVIHTESQMITPIDTVTTTVAPVTTIQTINNPPPVTVTTIDDDGAIVQSTSSSASSESYTASTDDGVPAIHTYHNRPIARVTDSYVTPTATYRSTTITQTEPSAGELPGVMSLEEEANMTLNATNPLYVSQ